MIDSHEELKKVTDRLQSESIIAIDTEFIRETTFFPRLEIIQLASEDQSWLVDFSAFYERANGDRDRLKKDLAPLIQLFTQPEVLKVFHAGQGDQECFLTSLDFLATPILDTAMAGSLCGFGDNVGLAQLLNQILQIRLKKGHARTNWSVRPLPKQLEEYAHADVTHLVKLTKALRERLEKLSRWDWALELSATLEDPSLYVLEPQELAAKLSRSGKLHTKSYPVLVSLIEWREKRIRELNIPRRRLADDGTLVDLANVQPKDLKHLGAFRGLNRKEVREGGEALLNVIREGRNRKLTLPKQRRSDPPSSEENRAITLLRCYVGVLADSNQLSSRHVVGPDKFLPLLRSKASTCDELVQRELLSKGASRLVGEEILAVVQGKRALSIENLGVKVVHVEEGASS